MSAAHDRVRALLAAVDAELEPLGYGPTTLAELAQAHLDAVLVLLDAHERTSRARQAPALTPVPRLAALDAYEGRWVAVLGEEVLADAETAVALVPRLRALGPGPADDAVVQFVWPPSTAYRVGAG